MSSGTFRSKILIVLAVLVTSACGIPTPAPPPAAATTTGVGVVPVATAAVPEGFVSRTAEVNGTRIHYVMGGSGPALVLLHGWPETWYAWREVMPSLAEDYTVIAPDLRGLGDSSEPAGGYEAEQVADDVYDVVSGLGFTDVSIVGHDWGAITAYAYTAAHRDEVRRLALLDVPMPGLGLEEVLASDPAATWWFYAFRNTPDLFQTLSTGREQPFLTWFWNRGAGNPNAVGADAVAEYTRTYSQPGAMRASFEYYRNVPGNAERFRQYAAEPLTMPVLAVGGDPALGAFGDQVEASARRLASDVRGVVIAGSGHWIAEEQPEQLIAELQQFLR